VGDICIYYALFVWKHL